MSFAGSPMFIPDPPGMESAQIVFLHWSDIIYESEIYD